MRTARPLAATMLGFALALAAVPATMAKGEDVVATLEAPLPPEAPPGAEVAIGWTLAIGQDDGSTIPFNAEGVFVQLRAGSGEPLEVGGRQDRPGHYVATVVVPEGGLAIVAIGLHGMACVEGGRCETADEFFTMAHPSAGAVFHAPPAPLSDPASGSGVGRAPIASSTPSDGPVVEPLALAAVAIGGCLVAILVLVLGGRPLIPRSTRS